jgi:hypothetical protein
VLVLYTEEKEEKKKKTKDDDDDDDGWLMKIVETRKKAKVKIVLI